ncbi:MAG TPA: fluoride efflux transporter CrcB [Spirochaetia bacterium]|nr:fluoride efflux transporter CrcB [Spirochaetia bacterium]
MVRVLLVGLGGAVGSVLRYLLGGLSQGIFQTSRFPIGTLLINLTGCFVIGLLSQLAESQGAFTELTRAFVFVGILGGYTTFSTFSNESLNLFRAGDVLLGVINVVVQALGGLGLAWAGRICGQLVWR